MGVQCDEVFDDMGTLLNEIVTVSCWSIVAEFLMAASTCFSVDSHMLQSDGVVA